MIPIDNRSLAIELYLCLFLLPPAAGVFGIKKELEELEEEDEIAEVRVDATIEGITVVLTWMEAVVVLFSRLVRSSIS